MPIRKPIVAGQFYEASFDGLNKQIESCFHSKFGPGDVPVSRSDKKIFGVVSPHAGYQFSGPCQAWVYKEVAESKFPVTFIITGPDHNRLGSVFSVSLNDWETPFGLIKNDKGFARELKGKCKFIEVNEDVHEHEHSIEVQLPFLQYANKDRIADIKIVPIAVSSYDYESCKELANAIAKINKNICIIASSDFTHYGPNYGYMPFLQNKKEGIYDMDKKAMDFIKEFNTKDFLGFVKMKKATICGTGAIAVAMETVKLLGAKKCKVLHYYTSGDVIDDYSNAVGYCAMVFG